MLGLRLRLLLLWWSATALANTEVETFTLYILLVVSGGIRKTSTGVIVAARYGEPLITLLVVKAARRGLWWHLATLRGSQDGVDGWRGLGGGIRWQLVFQTLLNSDVNQIPHVARRVAVAILRRWGTLDSRGGQWWWVLQFGRCDSCRPPLPRVGYVLHIW